METLTIQNKERTHTVTYVVSEEKLDQLIKLLESGKTEGEEFIKLSVRMKKRILPSAN